MRKRKAKAPPEVRNLTITLDELYERAAKHAGLELWPKTSRPVTKPFAVVPLDSDILGFLATHRITVQTRTDGIHTLVDENPQVKVPGWVPSNYWNQKTDGKVPLRIELCLELSINRTERGIQFWPKTSSNFLSPTDHLPNFRMFKAIVGWGVDGLPQIAYDVASSDGHITVGWWELGLGGLRDMPSLFTEFAGRNNELRRLIYRDNEIFSPNPTDANFVAEPDQPVVLKGWENQLKNFRDSLAV